MPQLNLLDARESMTAVSVTIFQPEPGTFSTDLEVRVSVAKGHGDPFTVWAAGLTGIESDFLQTLVSEVVTAWAYGERPRDVVLAAQAVRKQAREHKAAHEF